MEDFEYIFHDTLTIVCALRIGRNEISTRTEFTFGTMELGVDVFRGAVSKDKGA